MKFILQVDFRLNIFLQILCKLYLVSLKIKYQQLFSKNSGELPEQHNSTTILSEYGFQQYQFKNPFPSSDK